MPLVKRYYVMHTSSVILWPGVCQIQGKLQLQGKMCNSYCNLLKLSKTLISRKLVHVAITTNSISYSVHCLRQRVLKSSLRRAEVRLQHRQISQVHRTFFVNCTPNQSNSLLRRVLCRKRNAVLSVMLLMYRLLYSKKLSQTKRQQCLDLWVSMSQPYKQMQN